MTLEQRSLLDRKIEEARQRLAAADRELEARMRALQGTQGREKTVMAALLESTFATLRDAKRHLADLIELLENGVPDARPLERSCPVCSKTIRAAARLCGYCWSRVAPE